MDGSYDFVSDVVHRETQAPDGEGEGDGFDLTAGGIHEVVGAGSVDFGGGELEDAESAAVGTEKRDPEDDYGWWNLGSGTYLLRYNESLDGDRTVRLETRDELLRRGAYHPTVRVSSLGPVPLTVGGAGVRIKENARVSTVY